MKLSYSNAICIFYNCNTFTAFTGNYKTCINQIGHNDNALRNF